MPRYAQIDQEGYVVSDSRLSGIVEQENMIPLEEDFDLTNKRWNGRGWEDYEPAPAPQPPTEAQIAQAKLDYLMMMQETL